MNISKSSSDFAPLLKALQQVEYQLELKGASRVLVAAANLKKFKRQELASHNTVTERKLLGARVPVRGRRHLNQSRLVRARWPKDHLHEVTEPALNFILAGRADMRIANYSVQCPPGDLLYIPADLPRSDGSQPDYVEATPQSFCDVLLFSPGLVADFGLECSITHSRGKKRIPGNIDERCWVRNSLIAQLYYGICNELDSKGNTKSTFHLLMALLAQLQGEIKEGNVMSAWPHSLVSTSQAKQTFIQQAVEYIDNHIGESLTIDIVARQVGVSRTVLTREFRREMGESFRKYLINQRVKLAEVLLKEANLPVRKAASDVGLSPDRLRVLFHERHGCSPDEFRGQ